MHTMIGFVAALSCGATASYFLGSRMKRGADYLNSITRVIHLRQLEDLLTEKPRGLLVVVSGSVASAAPFVCKDNDILQAELHLKIKVEDGGFIDKTISYLLQRKETPWHLEDSTGRVNIVGAQDALGFDATLQKYRLDRPAAEILDSLAKPEGAMVSAHSLYGRALNVGTFLTFVGEAVRDKAGNLMIRKPKEESFMVFSGEGSFDKMVNYIKSESEHHLLFYKISATIAVALAVMYGVDLIMGLCVGSESDSEENHREEEE
ncbi:unnamed protein product [Thlaspi arvense]|uniref:RING-type E3 ubiquitin transferase n=1 Tax=Thlaspi arvense TaxID=13288 RepID=A0AAU9RB54_THLAR|nr:unnamed protein product [Thlaspi arvense]